MSAPEKLGRFDHHPDPAIDFCFEVELLENINLNAKLGLCGWGHEEERETLDERIERALGFLVGVDENCIAAKAALCELAVERGFIVTGEIAYFGQPLLRRTTTREDEQ